MHQKIDPIEVVKEARRWVGTPWRHEGRTIRKGVDCAGLIICTAANLDLVHVTITGYSLYPDGHTMEDYCRAHLIHVPLLTEMQYGDVVILGDLQWPHHLAIIGDKGYPFSIIHAHNNPTAKKNKKKVVEHRLDSKWMSKVKSCYRYPGVECVS